VDENAINGLMEVAMVGQMDTPDALCVQTESVMGSVFVFLRPVGSAEKRVPLYPTVGYHRERSDVPWSALENTGDALQVTVLVFWWERRIISLGKGGRGEGASNPHTGGLAGRVVLAPLPRTHAGTDQRQQEKGERSKRREGTKVGHRWVPEWECGGWGGSSGA